MKNIILSLTLIFFVGQGVIAQTVKPASMPKSTTPKKLKPRLTLDFISKGGGIDLESFDKIENFIKNHAKKPVYDVKQKGKEGEKTITSMLKELSKEEQTAFVLEIKNLIAKPELVLVKEYPAPKKLAATATAISSTTASRLVVSFISKGAGIDLKSQENIHSYIDKHRKKPAFEERRWGREGEVDYVFKLTELNADEQKIFIDEVKKLIINVDMVFVRENEEYVKKGR